MTNPIPPTLGLVLAGGLARRMGGGDKARIEIGGVSILDRVLAPPVGAMRRHHHQRQWRPRALRRHRLHRRARQRAGLSRPARRHPGRARLAGRAEQRRRMAAQRAGRLPVSARRPGRAPAPGPRKMGAGVPLACARSGEWRHPVVGLWPLALRADLRKALVEEGLRKIEVWTARHGVAVADWPAEPVDPVPQRQHARGRRARRRALRCNIRASEFLTGRAPRPYLL